MTGVTKQWTSVDRMGSRRAGFTLMELLVAIAIFLVIMTAVGALFVATLRTVKSGYLTVQANEEARMGLNILRRDLQSAFTSRDFGEYYQFYGTPIGMTFVGVVSSYDIYSTAPNLARVTYVLHPTATTKAFDTEIYDENTDTFSPGTVTTYGLLRYIEPGVRDLDSFPVNWEADPALEQEIAAVENLVNNGWEPHIVESMVKAKKRQLWMRMLSEPTNAFEQATNTTDNFPSFWDLDRGTGVPDPEDYLVAENIVAAYPPSLGAHDHSYSLRFPGAAYEEIVHFEYGLTHGQDITLRAFWNAEANMARPFFTDPEFQSSQPVTAQNPANPLFTDLSGQPLAEYIGTPINPRLPEVVRINTILRYESPHLGAPDQDRTMQQLVDVPSGFMRTTPDWFNAQ